MPFHNNQSQPDHTNYSTAQDKQFGAANAIFQASQALGSVGAPLSHLRNSSTSGPGTDDLFFSGGNAQGVNGSSTSASFLNAAGTGSGLPNAPASLPPLPYPPSQYQTPRRAPTFSRQPEELHIPSASSAMGDIHHYQPPPAYGGGEGLSIHLQPSTPQYSSGTTSNPVPGALQPGPIGRPPPMSSNTAPGSIPTLPQLSTQMQQGPASSRSVTLNHAHSYSRSSPSGMDQSKFKPFSNTPEASKYSSSNTTYVPQTPQGSSYSPLGLADIRPRTDSNFMDDTTSPNVYSGISDRQYPRNSNYQAPWPIYALDWCRWPQRSNGNPSGKVAIGSYLEDNHNYIQILDSQKTQSNPDDPHGEKGYDFIKTAEATHSYPVTRILWEPPSSAKQNTDLLATSGDHLRLWSLPSDLQSQQSNSINRSSNQKEQPLQKLSPLALLSNSKSPEHTAPITSLDWNVVSPSLIITSSIDTTCTIWDIPTLTAKTQLIAHDKEVFDVRFCAQSIDVFVSCGADGSVRMFDLRSLEHSTIIYEPSDKGDKNAIGSPGNMSPTTAQQTMSFPPPLLRIAASPHDAHLLATFSQDSKIIRVLDVRQPGQALLELKGHGAAVNCIEWSPSHRGLLASGADDSLVLMWDLMSHAGAVNPQQQTGGANSERGPSAMWQCDHEVSNISWAPTNGTLGVAGGKGFWGVSM